MVARTDSAVAVTPLDSELWLALDADFEWHAVERAQGEDPVGDLEHRVLGAEWEVLDGAGLGEAPPSQLGSVHARHRLSAGDSGGSSRDSDVEREREHVSPRARGADARSEREGVERGCPLDPSRLVRPGTTKAHS